MTRTALYIRVSTEEQALHGFSLEAQREALVAYAKKHELQVVDTYVDEGFSARKKYTKRKEFMRMLHDVQNDRLDLILFIKLDRWFRNIADYYKIQEILDAHNVGWKTTEEHYDTTTTNGRLYINIRLSVAQDESDRTSDRIKFVFENKVARGEVISGAVPMGFKIENKRLMHDPEKVDIVRDLYEHYATHQSKHGSKLYLINQYGINIEKSNLNIMLKNPLYKGEYRGNQSYCEPIVSKELFEKVQKVNAERYTRRPPTGRVYIFSGLMRCAECGHVCTGIFSQHKYFYYRCNWTYSEHRCNNKKNYNEKMIEEWLLNNLEDKVKELAYDIEMRNKQRPAPVVDKAKIRRKLEKLKELYVNDLISLDDYRKDYESLNEQLAEKIEAGDETPNVGELIRLIDSGLLNYYSEMDKKERRALWRSIIKEIRVDSNKNIAVFFL